MDNQTKTEKLKKLQKLSEKINDKLGKNIIKKASEHVVKRVNTGIMFLDYLSDGFPAGSRIQIWGEKIYGKKTGKKDASEFTEKNNGGFGVRRRIK